MDYLKFGFAVLIACALLFALIALITFLPYVMVALVLIGGVLVLATILYDIMDSF